MIDPTNVPPVADDERLARFVTHARQFRSSDGTVKQDAFIPHPHLELSVTRHLQATEQEIWDVGIEIALGQSKKLCGRADLLAGFCRSESLRVEATPLERNSNHADLAGWPAAKQDQKAIALKLAASALFVPNVSTT
jgi:hypothetical protein